MKPKLCKSCKLIFQPTKRMQQVCSWECGVKWGREKDAKKLAKAQREDTKRRKAAIETLPQLLKKCQVSFNKFINTRDAHLPCIACGEPITTVPHASHYLSVGARPNLRFSEKNVHRGCSKCNLFLHGNLVNFRRRLIVKIGLESVEELETDHSTKNYTRDDLIALAKIYRKRTRELSNDKNPPTLATLGDYDLHDDPGWE